MTSNEIAARQHERELKECRSILSLIYNGAIPEDIAKEMLSRFHGSILSEVMLDTFNRVSGCFAFNETYLDSEEQEA